MSHKKVKNREYQEHDLSRQKENEIRLYLSEKRKERDKRKDEFEKLILKLTKKYDDFDETRRPSEVFDDAGVVDNYDASGQMKIIMVLTKLDVY